MDRLDRVDSEDGVDRGPSVAVQAPKSAKAIRCVDSSYFRIRPRSWELGISTVDDWGRCWAVRLVAGTVPVVLSAVGRFPGAAWPRRSIRIGLSRYYTVPMPRWDCGSSHWLAREGYESGFFTKFRGRCAAAIGQLIVHEPAGPAQPPPSRFEHLDARFQNGRRSRAPALGAARRSDATLLRAVLLGIMHPPLQMPAAGRRFREPQ